MILCGEEATGPLVSLLSEHGLKPQSSQRRNLDGSAAVSWIVLASVTIRTAPVFLRVLSEFLTRNRVQRIEVSGVTIDNPRPEDVDRLLGGFPAEEEAPPQ